MRVTVLRCGVGMSFNIEVIKDKVLSDNYFILRNITYDLTRKNGDVIRHKREVYDGEMAPLFCCITRIKRAWS
jgi:hypothetical protein